MGAAAMAGLKAGVFNSLDDLSASWQLEREFIPQMSEDERQQHLARWKDALQRVRSDLN